MTPVALLLALIGVLTIVPCIQADALAWDLQLRAASLTVPTVGTDTSTASGSESGSVTATSNGSSSGSASATPSPVPTTETVVVTTSLSGSGGSAVLSTFTTTETTLVVPNVTTTTTSTAFPSLSTYTPCVVNCLDTAVALANCTSLTNVTCYCETTSFAKNLFSCVSSNCTDQIGGAEGLAQQFCNLETPSAVSLSFPSTSGVSASVNTTIGSTATLTSPGAPATSSSSAVVTYGLTWLGSQNAVLGSLLGVALGVMMMCS